MAYILHRIQFLVAVKSLMYIFIRVLGTSEFLFTLSILSDAFELDANIANFV